jgi:hypothetical protein
MNTSDFRVIDKRMDVLSLLTEAGPFAGGRVWQSFPGGRTVVTVLQIQVDSGNEKVILKTTDTSSFQTTCPLYVSINFKSLIFKIEAGQFKVRHDSLVCPFPNSGRAMECRKNPRLEVPAKMNFHVTIRSLINTSVELKARLLDISDAGMGVMIAENNKDFFQKNPRFKVEELGNIELSSTPYVTVSHISLKARGLKKGEAKVGLCFDEVLPSKVYALLKQKLQVTPELAVAE